MSKYPSELQSLKFFPTELPNFQDELSENGFIVGKQKKDNTQVLKK